MKQKSYPFRVGDHARIKSTATAKKILQDVWLQPSVVSGLDVEILELRSREFGPHDRPKQRHVCHHICMEGRREKDMYVPPAALQLVSRKRKASK